MCGVKQGKLALISFITLLLCLYMASSFAADVTVTTAGDMLKRVTQQFPQLMQLVTAFAYVAGFYFVMVGIMKMKHLGEMRTMMMHEHSVKGPLVYIFIGAALIYLPGSIRSGVGTFWDNPHPIGYIDNPGEWNDVIGACFMAVQLFGVIAFIRGLLILSHLAGQGGGHQGSLGRGMTHIIGGVLCINISEFVKVVLATIGVTISGFNG